MLVESVLAQSPNNIFALNQLSALRFIQGNTIKALETATRVLELDPANQTALTNIKTLRASLRGLRS